MHIIIKKKQTKSQTSKNKQISGYSQIITTIVQTKYLKQMSKLTILSSIKLCQKNLQNNSSTWKSSKGQENF